VLGEDLGYYQNASLATPYLHFRLSKNSLQNQNSLEKTALIFQNFIKEKPDVIVDEEGVFEELLKLFPPLKDSYQTTSKGVYTKK